MAEPSDASLLSFLLRQSDMILLLCGSPVVWYIAQRSRRHDQLGAPGVVHGTAARVIHQLRQVFSALLLGTELMERRATKAQQVALAELSQRLHLVAREGIAELALLGEPDRADLVD
jgi:hypothetical protein